MQAAFFVGIVVGSDNDVLVLVLSAVAGILGLAISTPFQAALLTVIYFDLRVRKEGFDLELLADGIGGSRAVGRARRAGRGRWRAGGVGGGGDRPHGRAVLAAAARLAAAAASRRCAQGAAGGPCAVGPDAGRAAAGRSLWDVPSRDEPRPEDPPDDPPHLPGVPYG